MLLELLARIVDRVLAHDALLRDAIEIRRDGGPDRGVADPFVETLIDETPACSVELRLHAVHLLPGLGRHKAGIILQLGCSLEHLVIVARHPPATSGTRRTPAAPESGRSASRRRPAPTHPGSAPGRRYRRPTAAPSRAT